MEKPYTVPPSGTSSYEGDGFSGRLNPGFGYKVDAVMINGFAKVKGFEFFGTLEHAQGRTSTEVSNRQFTQYAVDGIYRFGKSEDLFVGVRYNNVLAEMKALVDIDEWQMRVRDLPDLISFTPKNLMRALKASTGKVQERDILRYLHKSALNEAMIDDGLLILQGSGERFVFDVVGFGPLDDLLVEHKLTEAGVSYHPRSIARSDRVARILGEGWSVCELNRLMMLQRAEETHGLLLRG